MKSPVTKKEMILTKEKTSIEFRKEKFEIVFHYYKCEDSGQQFTNKALDEVNVNQVYNKYREKFIIPFPDEISEIRKKYGLSGSKMSEVLGFGINSYRQYEAGEVPSIANAKLIKMAEDPNKFIDMVELSGTLDEKLKTKYIQKAKFLAEEKKRDLLDFKGYLLGNHLADRYSGYRKPNFEKFTEMVVYFSEKMEPFKYKMNKLLFYADFSMFKQSGFSISGVRYQAIQMGPAPYNFQSIFEYLVNQGEIDIAYTQFPQGYVGEQFKPLKNRTFNESLFSETELKTLEKISKLFKTTSTKDIIELSRTEDAWKENEKNKSLISYEYAFEMNNVK